MTHAQTNNYWINQRALHISLNAIGNPDYIVGSVASGAVIMVYMKDIGTDDFFGYDAGHNHKRWNLTLSPTAFGSTAKKYVYVAIPRDTTKQTATVVFPSEEIDLYGYAHDITKDEDGKDVDTPRLVGSDAYYYIWLRGIISSSGDNGTTPREWEQDIDCGMLSTDEGIASASTEFYSYDPYSDTITFLKNIADATFLRLKATKAEVTKLVLGASEFIGKAVFGTTPKASDNTIVTPKYVDDFGNTLLTKFLRKDTDDETTHKLTMGAAHVKGDTTLDGNTTIGGALASSNYTTGAPLAGSGWSINHNGDIEGESIKVRGFMEVPEIRFNRASLIVGTNIQSACGGIIKEVYPDKENTSKGYAVLELGDDDIAGSIQVGDLCWGYWHDISTDNSNAKEDSDDYCGTINYRGFTTVYFQIASIENTNSTAFRYELKPGTTVHPFVGMHFGGRGNSTLKAEDGKPMYPERQGFTMSTPLYTATYSNVGGWDWTEQSKYIVRVTGLLDGFEVLANVAPNTWKGVYGTIDCNFFLRGTVQQVSDTQRLLYITLSSNGMIDPDETETVSIIVRDNYFRTRTSEFKITVNDIEQTATDGIVRLTYPYADLPNELNRFTVKATGTSWQNEWDAASHSYKRKDITVTLEDTFTIQKLREQTLSIVTNTDNDPFIDQIEPKHIVCKVQSSGGYDMTEQVTTWQITRESSSADADAIWAQRSKVKAFNGTIDLYWSDDVTLNDLDLTQPTTKFHITATIGEETLTTTLNI